MGSVEQALQAVESANAEPRNPAHLQRALRLLRERNSLVSSNIIDVTGIAAILTGQDSPLIEVAWPPGKGTVHAVFAGTLDGATASLSGIGLRIRRENSQEVHLSSRGGEAYPRLITMRGGLQGDAVPWVELKSFRVQSGSPWNIWFRNFSTGTLTPFIHFLYEEDAGQ